MLGLVFFIILFSNSNSAPAHSNPCSCAVMKSSDSNSTAEIEHRLDIKQLQLQCDEEGTEKCKNLCVALAEATNAELKGRQRFCKALKKDINITPSVFSKVCDKPYTYTGLTFTEEICCSKGLWVKC